MRFLILVIVLLLGLCGVVEAQDSAWSKPMPIVTAGNVRLAYRWRLVALEPDQDRGAIEWAFANLSDSTVSFSYELTTDRKEHFIGRTRLAPRTLRVAGWFFLGNRISGIEATDLDIKPHDEIGHH